MNIIAHRGMWRMPEEKNTYKAIARAFDCNVGIETDIRDYKGQLVVSHNIAREDCFCLEDLFRTYTACECTCQLALNVKADGIQELLKKLLDKYHITNYFLFDMSIPELVVNEKEGLLFYTRQSDIEPFCVRYSQAKGVWMDFFYETDWLNTDRIIEHIQNGKEVCIVSPELHGIEEDRLWEIIKRTPELVESEYLTLCTDKPEKANNFFER